MSLTAEPKRIDRSDLPARPPESQISEHGSGGRRLRKLRGKVLIGLVLLAGGVLVAAAGSMLLGDLNKPDQTLVFHTVTRGNLAITVTERGNLESQTNVEIICEVDDIQGDDVHGTMALFIVPNGSEVKAGEVLVRLDDSGIKERKDRQILAAEAAKAEKIKAKAKYNNQLTQNKTAQAEAELQVDLAVLTLEMFEDSEMGTHKLALDEIDRGIEDINSQILEAKASLELRKDALEGIESLFKLGYRGRSEVERSRLEYLQAESQYAALRNKLKTQQATRKKTTLYERQMQEMTLQGAKETAKRTLAQVKEDNIALEQQAKAATEAADRASEKEDELLARYEEQLTKCVITAPEDGMVAYAVSRHRWSQPIRQGGPISPKQHILSLPSLTEMQVKTRIHESVLNLVKPKLPVTIRVDAFRDRAYKGSVQSVAVMPDTDAQASSDIKVYETVVTIDEEVQDLKPGMTAVVEIHIETLRDVLSVPVLAIVQVRADSWCYVEPKDRKGTIERRPVKLGRTNDKFIVVREGIEEGDRVVLNPMAIVDESQKEDEDSKEESEQDAEAPDEPSEERSAGPPSGGPPRGGMPPNGPPQSIQGGGPPRQGPAASGAPGQRAGGGPRGSGGRGGASPNRQRPPGGGMRPGGGSRPSTPRTETP